MCVSYRANEIKNYLPANIKCSATIGSNANRIPKGPVWHSFDLNQHLLFREVKLPFQTRGDKLLTLYWDMNLMSNNRILELHW